MTKKDKYIVKLSRIHDIPPCIYHVYGRFTSIRMSQNSTSMNKIVTGLRCAGT